MENIREIVLDTLLSMERDVELSHQLIRSVLDKYDYLDVREKKFIKRVTEGTLERRLELDYYIDQFSSVPVGKMKPVIRCLMRMSVYQLIYMDGIPDSAVCNEACKLAGKKKFVNLKGFVNGVLRRIARERDELPLPDPKENVLAYLCIKYSMPEPITKEWLAVYGEFVTEKMLEGLLEIHPVSLRLSENLSKEEAKKVFHGLGQEGISLQRSAYDDGILLARDLEGLNDLSDFREGRLIVQDVSSALAVKAAGIQEGALVIDACAAPGGKSILASELTGKAGRVISGDVSEGKCAKIRENVARMGRDNVEIRVWDARLPQEDLLQSADVLLLDVPCSGLGILGKKRDIKYHVSEEGFVQLEILQKEIIEGAWRCVKPGGILLYSTCTIRRQENRDVVKWILQNLPFEPVSLEETLPPLVWEGVVQEKQAAGVDAGDPAEKCCAQLLPGLMEADGFFFAKFRRKIDA